MGTYKHISIFLVWLFAFFTATAQSQTQAPLYVWSDAEGGERNEMLYFRKEVNITSPIKEATLAIYVDSRYALYVNQQYIGFGPVRSYHTHPKYDRYDLKDYLKEGKNIIAIQALCNGMETYQLYDNKGGLTTLGTIQTAKEHIDLSQHSEWLFKKASGYEQDMPRLSFATGPIEVFDARKDWNWNAPHISLEEWKKPLPLAQQNTWGTLEKRPIPFLTQKEVLIEKKVRAFKIKANEDIYSFRIPTPDKNQKEYNRSHTGIAYTYIYAPKAQQVNAGLWWGEYFLNQKKIKKVSEENAKTYREEYTLELQEGWNLLTCRYGIIWGSWDFYMALPTEANLLVSANKNVQEKGTFYSYVPFHKDKEAVLHKLDLKKAPSENIETIQDWVLQTQNLKNTQPARDLVWMEADLEKPLAIKEGNLLKIKKSERGTTLFVNLDQIQLGRFFIEGNFPDGAIIDLGFSEELNKEGEPFLYRRKQINAGLRFITSEKVHRYESFKPYGAKYLKINIRNTTAAVELHRIGMIRQVYPFEEEGSFACSDTTLTKIWEAGWRTLRLCAEDSYTDTPFRERGLYAGDMFPETAITMVGTRDMRLVDYSLRIFQDMYHPQMIEGNAGENMDFIFITLLTMDYLKDYTGDWSLIEEYYNNYKSFVEINLKRKNTQGLVEAFRVFTEWTTINKAEAAMGTYQAVMYKAMHIMATWAEHLGKPKAEISFFRKEAEELKKAVNEQLWDAEKGLYLDGIKAGKKIEEHHLSTSIWAMLYGLSNQKQEKQINENLAVELQDIGNKFRARKIAAYSSFYLFAYLYREENAALAEEFMKKYWSPMVLGRKNPTVWENFDIDHFHGTSSHAWSGHPTYFLSTEALGVNLGFNKAFSRDQIEICPQAATLEWAKGSVSHPLGKVEVAWHIEGEQLMLAYKAPKGAKVKVAPKGRLAKLKLVIIPFEEKTAK